MATEWLWMNYPEPAQLHDYRHLGADYRERERSTRKKKRWAARFRAMPQLERYALLTALEEVAASGGKDGRYEKGIPSGPAQDRGTDLHESG